MQSVHLPRRRGTLPGAGGGGRDDTDAGSGGSRDSTARGCCCRMAPSCMSGRTSGAHS